MIIITNKNEKIQIDDNPVWNEFHQRFYAWGYRWIKSRKKFSSVKGLHNFLTWELTS